MVKDNNNGSISPLPQLKMKRCQSEGNIHFQACTYSCHHIQPNMRSYNAEACTYGNRQLSSSSPSTAPSDTAKVTNPNTPYESSTCTTAYIRIKGCRLRSLTSAMFISLKETAYKNDGDRKALNNTACISRRIELDTVSSSLSINNYTDSNDIYPPLLNNNTLYVLISNSSVMLHIIAASWVFYALIFDVKMWISSMEDLRVTLGLDKDLDDNTEHIILKIWIISIQLRYVCTDMAAVYYNIYPGHNNDKNVNTDSSASSSDKPDVLIQHTIWQHFIEGIICSMTFLTQGSKGCFIFGIVCLLWTLLWAIAWALITRRYNIINNSSTSKAGRSIHLSSIVASNNDRSRFRRRKEMVKKVAERVKTTYRKSRLVQRYKSILRSNFNN